MSAKVIVKEKRKLSHTDVNCLVLLSSIMFRGSGKVSELVALFKEPGFSGSLHKMLSPFGRQIDNAIIAIYKKDAKALKRAFKAIKLVSPEPRQTKDLIDTVLSTAYGRRWKWIASNISKSELAERAPEWKRLVKLRTFLNKTLK